MQDVNSTLSKLVVSFSAMSPLSPVALQEAAAGPSASEEYSTVNLVVSPPVSSPVSPDQTQVSPIMCPQILCHFLFLFQEILLVQSMLEENGDKV